MSTDTTETGAARSAESDDFVPRFRRIFPGSLLAAVLLALAALLATVGRLDPVRQLELFSTGFFDLFKVQMALLLWWLLSAAVVESPPVGALFDRLADAVPTSQPWIVGATAFFALGLGWLNWALGLIGGVLIGRKLCERADRESVPVHYPSVLTAGLLSLVVANQGPTSPGGLLMTGEGLSFLRESAGAISLGAFAFHPANLLASAVLIATLPVVLVALAPDEGDRRTIAADRSLLDIRDRLAHYSRPVSGEMVVADRIEQSRALTAVVVAVGGASIAWNWLAGAPFSMLNVLFALVILGMAVQVRPMALVEKTADATRWVLHLAIPFLFYGGIVALLGASGRYDPIGALVATDVAGGVPIGAFLAALGVGLLVPDPGSVWVLLGPGVTAAESAIVPPLAAVMYGAGLSNLWLGFLFVGLLPVPGCDWPSFVRYAAVVTGYVSVVVLGAFALV